MKNECPVSIDELRHDAQEHQVTIEEDPDVELRESASEMSEETQKQFDCIQALVDDWREEGTDPYLLGCKFFFYMNQELSFSRSWSRACGRQLRDIKKQLT
jgi:hypothetical protein